MMPATPIPCCLLLLFLTAGTASAGPGPSAPADAVIQKKWVFMTVHPDGTVSERVRTETVVSSLWAFNSLGDPRIAYDKEYQELVVYSSTTVGPDGTNKDSPARALNSSTPDQVASCPAFARFTELVVTFVGMEKGATTVLEYELKDKKPWRSHVERVFYFGDRFPVKESSIEIRLPARLPFQHGLFAVGASSIAAIEPVQERADTVYKWVATDLPAYAVPQPEFAIRTPHVVFSTARSWSELLSLLGTALFAPIEDRSRLEKYSKVLLGKEAGDGKALSLRMFKLLSGLRKSLNTLGQDLGFWTWDVRPPDDVLSTRQATRLESAMLLARLLELEGLHPKVLLSSPAAEQGAAGPPALSTTNAVYVELSVEGRKVFVDVDGFKAMPFVRFPGESQLAVLDPRGRHHVTTAADYLPELYAAVSVAAEVHAAVDGIRLTVSISTGGAASLWFDLMTYPDEAAAGAAMAEHFFPGLTVDSFVVSESSPQAARVQIAAHKERSGEDGPVKVNLAPFADGVEKHLLPALTGTKTGQLISGKVEYALALTIEAETGVLVPAIPPGSISFGENSYSVTAGTEGNRLSILRNFTSAGLVQQDGPGAGNPEAALLRRFLGDNEVEALWDPEE